MSLEKDGGAQPQLSGNLRVSELEMQSLYWLVAGRSSGLGFQLGQNSFPSWQTLLVRHPDWASEVAEKGENF